MDGKTKKRMSILFMLSREPTGIPEAEAWTLVHDLDPGARFESPDPGLLLAETSADPHVMEARVAFSRRVGAARAGRGVRQRAPLPLAQRHLQGEGLRRERRGERRGNGDDLIDSRQGRGQGLARRARPGDLRLCRRRRRCGWWWRWREQREEEDLSFYNQSGRDEAGLGDEEARSRAFFHPSAIFPKLSRALVNLSGVQAGEGSSTRSAGRGASS